MNKADLISHVAAEAELSKAKAEQAVNAMINGIKDALAEGKRVTLIGFGSFAVSERKARKGRHPRTGAEIDIPASKVLKFKPGKEIKEVLNG
ncbi:MAG: HU family DNA-binding protein [Deltaproteobacteria bacterium]|nr:MAG: HU family DNA-binding protein [Deltaproteobacteria bacterium]